MSELQGKIESLLAAIDQQIDGAGHKDVLNISQMNVDPTLADNADTVINAIATHLNVKCPSHKSTVRMGGHRRIEIKMRSKRA